MIITIESTNKIVEIDGIPARIWEGTAHDGIKLHCYITRIAIDKNETRLTEFEKQLTLCITPSPQIDAMPNRLIL